MKLGIRIPFTGVIEGEDVSRVVQAADGLGFEAGFVGDHTVWPADDDTSLNPTTAKGKYPKPPNEPSYDAVTTLAYAAAASRTLRLGVAVAVLANRNPLHFAKQVATLDRLSGGRVICGLGLGWLKGEFDALGVPFARRRQRLEEGIGVMRALWTEPRAEFHGAEFDFGPVWCEPKPLQDPLPIWLGGHAPPALERSAAMGDGWYGSFLTPAAAAPLVQRLRRARRDSPRRAHNFTVAISRAVAWPDDPPEAALMGEMLAPESLRDTLRRYEDLGVDLFVLDTFMRRTDDLIAVMEMAVRATR